MSAPSQEQVTQLLADWSQGDKAALDALMPLVYDELRRLARRYLARERPGHTLQPTALVHEAFLRLVDQRSVNWRSRAHFFGIAAQMMRRILVDHARKSQATKRGGQMAKLTIDPQIASPDQRALDLMVLDEALVGLEQLDTRQGKIVELRFFGGLSMNEVAEVVGISTATVEREWSTARA